MFNSNPYSNIRLITSLSSHEHILKSAPTTFSAYIYYFALRTQLNTFPKQFHSVTIINLDFVSTYLRHVAISYILKGEFLIAQLAHLVQNVTKNTI